MKAENNETNSATENASVPRAHVATYAQNRRGDGYNIRVIGPNAAAFAGRTIPVTRRDGIEENEKLTSLIWNGTDDETGKPVALYRFVSRPRDAKPPQQEIPF